MSIKRIRPSIGTAILLGLREGDLPSPPTTAYLMYGEGCSNNCGFCTQARSSSSGSDMLSRVTWPQFPIETVLTSLERSRDRGIQRICIQCLNDRRITNELPELVREIDARTSGTPISVSISTNEIGTISSLKEAGVDRVGIAVDIADPELYEKVKGRDAGNPLNWNDIWNAVQNAADVLGSGNVSTHLIIGMGETDLQVFRMMQRCMRLGILLSLFSYTPMRGTRMTFTTPSLERYRSMQFMRMILMEKGIQEGFEFDADGKLISIPDNVSISDNWIMTKGCSGCNRPYYNERPMGPMYNYPFPPDQDELDEALDLVRKYVYGAHSMG